jgi:hypothetical protein
MAMKRQKERAGAKAGLAVPWTAGWIQMVRNRWIRIGAAAGIGEIPDNHSAKWIAATRAVAFTTKSWP